MTTLTDRYVWAVLRAVPQPQRADLEPEIRALVADTMDAHGDAGSPEAAERAALVELGDPDTLAGRYVDRTQFLIGPRLYPEWRRLVGLLLPIVVTVITIVSGAASWLAGNAPGAVIASSLAAGFNVAVQTLFWFTLVFVIAERTAGRDMIPTRTWTPDQLPTAPARERPGLGEMAMTIVANVFVIVGILWVQTMSPITIEGIAYPLFDPALWSFWLPYFIVLAGLEIVFAVVLYLRGGWSWPLAVVNAGLNLAFAIPALRLLQEDLLFNPALVAKLESITGGLWYTPTTTIIGIVIVAVTTIDAIDGFRKAWAGSRGAGIVAAAI